MKILKNFNNFKLNENDDIAQIDLFIDNKYDSSWYYFEDAIQNGLIENYIGLTNEDYEEIIDSNEKYNNYPQTIDELTDEIYTNFEFLDKFFDMILEYSDDYMDKKFSVHIVGTDDSEIYNDLEYIPENN